MNDSSTQSVAIADSAPPIEAALTPLASVQVAADPSLRLATRGGCQSAASFGDASAELSALLHSVGLCDLGFRTRISVTGEDKFRWLNGMVTNAVAALAEGHGNYNFILNAQGRIQGDAYVYREAGRLLVETDGSQSDRLLEHFERFIIMDDVDLAELSGLTCLGIAGPHAAILLQRLGFAAAASLEMLEFQDISLGGVPTTVVRAYSLLVPCFELWFEPVQTETMQRILLEAGATPVALEAANALRILEGIPLYGVDIHDRNLVQETSQARALNFTKGCYLGQEIVERIRSRTTVHRFLRQLELSGAVPQAGAELRSPGEERSVGQLTSIATYALAGVPPVLALGYVRGDAIERRLPIEYDGGFATVLAEPPAVPGGIAA
jgi:folate-binding protein YgfZ